MPHVRERYIIRGLSDRYREANHNLIYRLPKVGGDGEAEREGLECERERARDQER